MLYKEIIFAEVAHFSKNHYRPSTENLIFSVPLYLTCLCVPEVVIIERNKLGSNEVWGGVK
jgi:hypothetical protein